MTAIANAIETITGTIGAVYSARSAYNERAAEIQADASLSEQGKEWKLASADGDYCNAVDDIYFGAYSEAIRAVESAAADYNEAFAWDSPQLAAAAAIVQHGSLPPAAIAALGDSFKSPAELLWLSEVAKKSGNDSLAMQLGDMGQDKKLSFDAQNDKIYYLVRNGASGSVPRDVFTALKELQAQAQAVGEALSPQE